MPNFSDLFAQFARIRAGVIGDIMLDTYLWGNVERISPEAPVPVVTLERREHRIGGAGNVALNLASLGAKVEMFSVIGRDQDGEMLEVLLAENGIGVSGQLKSPGRITTSKARVIGRNQQMMRLDSETTRNLSWEEEQELLRRIEIYLDRERPQVIIFEDYNKGVLTDRLIRDAVGLCRARGIITAVDPKQKNFFSYEGVTIFKPNLKEVREGLHLSLDDVDLTALEGVHGQLAANLKHEVSFITLSEKGIFYCDGRHGAIVPSHLRRIADVSGAGDTVIATASLVFAATRDLSLMAQVANIAGGLVCEEVGTVAISRERLLTECGELLE